MIIESADGWTRADVWADDAGVHVVLLARSRFTCRRGFEVFGEMSSTKPLHVVLDEVYALVHSCRAVHEVVYAVQ